MLAATAITFDMAVLEIYLPLMAGAAVSLVDRATAVDGVVMAEHTSDSVSLYPGLLQDGNSRYVDCRMTNARLERRDVDQRGV